VRILENIQLRLPLADKTRVVHFFESTQRENVVAALAGSVQMIDSAKTEATFQGRPACLLHFCLPFPMGFSTGISGPRSAGMD
jgi:hypothetical protein